jgi:branched-chain amino acid transport system substrate-binding protein
MSYKVLILTLLLAPVLAVAQPGQKSFRVGVTAPFTGDFASYGEQIRNGVELAKGDLARRGINLDVHYEDACIPSGAVSAINKLISLDKIQGLAANFCVIAMPAMATAIQKNKIPTFHAAGASDSILALGNYVFTTDLKVRTEARKLAEYAAVSLKAKTASVLSIATDFGEDYRKHFTARFEELGGKVLSSDSSAIGVNDFRTELISIKHRKPDVVFAAHLGLTLGVLLKQARELGLKQPFLGTYEAGDSSVRDVARDSANGLRFFVPEPAAKTSTIEEFEAKFQAKFKKPAGLLEANSYDSTTLLGDALERCGGDGSCVRDTFQRQRVYDGASGHFSLLGSEESQRHFVLKELRGDKVVIVGEG